jgi:hypothetical protein
MAGTHYSMTGDEVEALAGKLDKFGEQLSEKERATLLSVLSMAGSSIEEKVGDAEVETFSTGFTLGTFPTVSQTSLGTGFRSAFSPFTATRVNPLGSDVGDSVGITGTIMF